MRNFTAAAPGADCGATLLEGVGGEGQVRPGSRVDRAGLESPGSNNARRCEGQNADAGCPRMTPSHTYVLKLYSYCENML